MKVSVREMIKKSVHGTLQLSQLVFRIVCIHFVANVQSHT